MKRLIPLASIIVVVWLILLLTILAIAKVAFSINFGTRTLIQLAITDTSKILVSAVLVLIWLLAWKKIADAYLHRELRRRTTVA
ncbi:MAG TPA: hypothetical protein VLV31_04665 [Candidatus Acidoferrales bacterium]|nr:hypothetical protein [Candidatus Acidoferrales bacterium]